MINELKMQMWKLQSGAESPRSMGFSGSICGVCHMSHAENSALCAKKGGKAVVTIE